MRYLLPATVCFLTLSLSLSRAQSTLDECKELARANYPAIRQYSLIEKTKEYTLKNAAMDWIPKVTLGAQFTMQNKVPKFPDQFDNLLAAAGVEMPGMKKEQYKATVDVSQTIWDGGKYAADKQLALAEAKESQGSVDVEIYSLNGRIEEIYFGILLLNNKIELTKNKIALLESNLAQARSHVSNGTALQADADAIEAEMLAARQGLTKMTSAADSYLKMLEIFTGTKIDGSSLALPDIPEITSRENRRPEMAYIDAKIMKLKAQEKLLNVSSVPQIGLFAQAYYGYPGFDYFDGMMHNNMSFNAIAGIRLIWNISSFLTKKNNIENIRSARSTLEVQKDIFDFNTNLQVLGQNNEIERLQAELADDDRIVALRKNVRLAAESKLRNGVIDTNDLLMKITAENEAVINRTEHEILLIKKAYELRNTTNSK